MFRKCVSGSVIVLFLASQFATVPHEHAGMSKEHQSRHNERTHLHWGNVGHSHEHGSHGAIHHHGEIATEPNAQSATVSGCEVSQYNHDATAVYYAAVTLSRGAKLRDVTIDGTIVDLSTNHLVVPVERKVWKTHFDQPDLPFRPSGYQLCVSLRTLRI
jgi:hypothetical protein